MTEPTSERVCPATHPLMYFLKKELRILEEALLTYCVCVGGGSCLPQFAVGLGVWKGMLTGDTEGPLWATRGFCVAEPLYI